MNVIWLLWACSEEPQQETPSQEEPQELLEKTTELGPIRATVSLTPKEPKLGDPILLKLQVQAEENIEVDMPPFGEALGQFQMVDYSAGQSKTSSYYYEQEYTLQAPMSGLQRIPSLRVVFRDNRAGESQEEKEILTDEIALNIQSLLDEDAPLDFKPARMFLKEQRYTPVWVWGVLGTGVFFLGLILYARHRKRRTLVPYKNAYERAIEALFALENQEGRSVDAFYAEVSMILRRYIEQRFSVPAVERTTPELLPQLQDIAQIQPQKEYLKTFLYRADEVKYAQFEPSKDIQELEIVHLRAFLEATQEQEESAPQEEGTSA